MRWLAPALVALLAVTAELSLGRASGGPTVAFFLGRFHPLVVHLPIGFFLLVAVGEVATLHPRLRDRVEPALGLLVPLSAVAALAAFLMGQLLALEGGFPAQALTWHRRLTLLAVFGMVASWVAFEQQQATGRGRLLYRGALGATLGLLSLGAHFGGTMTRGEQYLSKYAPGPLKPMLGGAEPEEKPLVAAAPPAGAEPLVFQHVVLPILERHCVECHGPEKQKGKLRLDTLDELLKGGEGGGAIVAGSAAQSSLIKRMLLPVTDDERMPPEGKPSPPPEELALIQFWLDRGASPALKVKDALAPSASRALLERAAGGAPAPGEQAPTARATPASSSAGVGSAPSASAAAPNGELGTSPSDATGASPKGASPNDATGASASDVAASPTATAALAAGQAPASSGAPGAGVDGARFLATYCVKCHGPQKVKGKLRVDSLSALLAGGAEGPALVPGSPEQSSVVTRSRLPLSNDEHMPPPKEPQPSAAEVAAFAAWVRAGAGGPGAGKLAHPSAAAVVAGKTSAPSEVATAPSAALEATSPAAASERGGEPSASAQGATGAAATGASASGAIATAVKPAPPLAPTEHVALFHDAVQPLLAAKCGKCHIKTKPAGGLDVKSHASLMEGGYSGPGVVAKDRKNSPLLARLLLPEDDDERMPPAGEPGLSADEIELIGAWIEQGAPAEGPTLVAALPAGAVRALSALGVQAAPAPLAPRAGGCAACTVPGAPRSGLLGAQALGAGALALALLARRRRRR